MEILVFFSGIIIGVFAMSLAIINKRKRMPHTIIVKHYRGKHNKATHYM